MVSYATFLEFLYCRVTALGLQPGPGLALLVFAYSCGLLLRMQVGRKLFSHLYAPPACQPRVVNTRDREVFDLMKEQVHVSSAPAASELTELF
jgi:hypothetical protein